MKITIVGSGGFARKHASILADLPDVEVNAFCSRNRDHAASAAAWLSEKTGTQVSTYTDVAEMLDRERPDAGVIVVTPDGHGAIEFAHIDRGIPFLVEKPIGMDRETPDRIADAVERSSLITSVGFHLRYLDTTAALVAMLRAATPALANAYWMSTLPPPAWWRHAAESGGQLIEQTVHVIDLLRVLFGEAETVFAITSSQAIRDLHDDADVPDAGAAVIRMKSGMTATVINSCVGPQAMRVGVEVITPDALYELTPRSLRVRRMQENTEKQPAVDPYLLENQAFVKAVRSGTPGEIRCDYAEALRTHRLTMAIVESARSGQPVEVQA